MTKLNGFWKQIMPGLEIKAVGGVSLAQMCEKKGMEKGLKGYVKGLDDDEFNLFLAQVVMKASSKQIMGVNLTKQIGLLKELRK